MKIIKEDITYDMWLQMYKDTNVNKITLEEHTKYAKTLCSLEGRQYRESYCLKSLTLFKSVFDNKTHKRMDFNDYAAFESCSLT